MTSPRDTIRAAAQHVSRAEFLQAAIGGADPRQRDALRSKRDEEIERASELLDALKKQCRGSWQ